MRKPPDLLDQIKAMEDDLEALKAKQRTGKGNVKGYLHMEPGAFDLHFVADARIKKFMITLTHDTPNTYQMIDLSWFVSNHRSDPLNETGGIEISTQAQMVGPPQKGVTQWLLAFRNNSYPPEFGGGITNYDVWAKFLYYGTTDVSVSIVAVP